ncbi:transcriptional regulator [Bacillus fungorum]|uniref:Transcriptional regulator n=1 Tax=Bacillus fungorum TaxID=2039284 RepID=A0A2G6Q699_9BACI|nr:helix-turn-helix transcriptional regulator [Bacillus fungorum]PIE91930.1 transcriptional regulator [Bacillus fungorum]
MEENIFGQNLRKLRKIKGLSLNKLGIELGVTGSAISSWELGNKEPNFDMAKKIASYFMVSTDYLLNHQILDNDEHTKAIVTRLAHKMYEKSKDVLVFEEELLSYLGYLDYKNKSRHIALKNIENENEEKNV